jgi:hypothetical protein
MKKIVALLFVLSVTGCSTTHKDCSELLIKANELQTKVDEISEELKKYKELYGEIPTFDVKKGNFGIWKTKFYVDDFEEKTNERYVTNSDIILGKFSNSATENSDLAVIFLINNKDNISIMLFEYLHNNPVKNNGYNTVLVQDKDGNRYKLRASNHSDRVTLSDSQYYDKTGNKVLEKSHARMLYNILAKGGMIKFRIQSGEYTTSTYNFTINNADYLDEALKSIGVEIF